MKRFATLKNSVQSYQHPKEGEQPCRVFGNIDKHSTCEPCKQLLSQEDQGQDRDNKFAPLCTACSYKGLPDASVSSWDPVTGQVVLVLSHGVVIQEQVAAVGVFIGKQVHMGFLKGSLAQEMLSSSPSSPLGDSSTLGLKLGVGEAGRVSSSGRSTRRKRSNSQAAKELAVDIPTPPCTPPRSPTLRPMGVSASTTTARQQLWHKQALESLRRCRNGFSSSDTPSSSALKVEKEREETSQESDEGCSQDEQQDVTDQEEEDEQTDPSQVLTLLKPLVSDMYNFRLIPTGIADPIVVHQGGAMASSSSLSVLPSSGVGAGTAPMTLLTSMPTFPTKAKKCSRLPCYPIRRSSLVDSTAESSPTAPENESTEIATATTIIRATTMGDETPGGGGGSSLSNAASRVGKSIKAMSSACISMPCSPLLGSRIVCPTLPTPPLLSLCTAAANVLTNSMTALTPRCSLISASAAAFTSSSSSFSSSSSSSALSSRRSSRCSRSSSISSLALSTTTSMDSSNGAVAASAAAVDGTQAVAAVGVADVQPTGGATTVVVTDDIAGKDATEEERRPDYSHDEKGTSEDGLVKDVDDEDDEDDEEEDETPYPPPATPAEKLIEPRMDHSIYAAGAITGSKFVRYVLGNGIAIVADILRSEVV